MKTIAVVVGNNEYEEKTRLKNAVNDAKGMSDVFSRLGYETLTVLDGNISELCQLLEDFKTKINDFDASIFYFAGHGFQFNGENYLAAVDCPIEFGNQGICKKFSLMLSEITDIIKDAKTNINIIIIDACRVSIGRGVSTEFANVNAPEGTIIAFSTSPGETASDAGAEGHSIYTGTLLKYMGRERISVEEMFKKVRRTIYNLTDGNQTSWEHTSLVGDFYFNTGQMVYSTSIPYDESVVKDRNYLLKGNDIDNIIAALQSCNWDKQNPAINKFLQLEPSEITKDEQFIIGRNIYQSSSFAHQATNFIKNMNRSLEPYFDGEENHLLNGILFEVYFNNNGDFRYENIKQNMIEDIFNLRYDSKYRKSFEFLNEVLKPYQDDLYFIPLDGNERIIDIDIVAQNQLTKEFLTDKLISYEEIESIKVNQKEILIDFSKYSNVGLNNEGLIDSFSHYLFAPKEKLKIHSNIKLKKAHFKKKISDILV